MPAERTAPVRKADRADMHREIEDALRTVEGWADRLDATRGGDARWLLRQFDSAVSTLARVRVAIETVYPETKPQERP